MILAACMQAFISIIIKSVGTTIPISIQLIFYYLIPLFYFFPVIFKNGFAVLKTKLFYVHFIRGFFSLASVSCFFYSVKYIPLGASTTLFNMIPFFVPLLSQFFLKEKIHLKTYLGLFVAFPGILLMINTKISSFSTSHFLIGFSAAILMAISMVLLKYLVGKKESVNQIVFNQYSSCSLIALMLLALEIQFNPESFTLASFQLSPLTILFLIGLGLLSIGTQYCFSKAAQRMPVSQLAPFLYLSVPLSGTMGFLLWGQSLSFNMIAGSLLIFIGLCICSWKEKSKRAHQIIEEASSTD